MKDTLIGQRYRIESLIGEGGMASVYSAKDMKLDRKVAIKILHPHLGRNADVRERFFLEAKTVSTLDHPNIIKVYDFSGLDSEQLWMVTEILYGVDLAEFVQEFPKNRLHFAVSALVAREICAALHQAHKLNVVHRDIKPENIFMLKKGQVKLMDFGIAKVHRANATQTGMFMGSPSYMSPEQIRGTDVDIRADIYSLSVLFYEIVTGQLPYSGQTTAEVINRIMGGRYSAPNLLVTELPKPLNDIIVRGLQSSKELRFNNAKEMALEIDKFLQKIGFRESRIELEEFTKNRAKFDQRLAELNKIFRAQSGAKASQPGERSAKPKALPTMILNDVDPTKTTIPPPPRKSSDPVQKPLGAVKVGQNGQSLPPMSKPQQSYPPNSNAQRARSSQIGQTQGPRTTNNPSSKRKHYIRTVSGIENIRKSNSGLTILFFGIAIGIILLVFFGKDKFPIKGREGRDRGAERVTQAPGKKPEAAEETNEKPMIEGGSTSVLEPETVVLENDGKQKPKIPSEKPAPQKAAVVPPPPTPRSSFSKPKEKLEKEKETEKEKISKTNEERPKPPETKPKPETVAVVNSPVEKANEDKIPKENREPKETSETKESKAPGALKIAAVPAARVFIDGKAYGTTNESSSGKGIRLDPGTYSLKVARPGYHTDEQTIQIKGGETKQLNITLQKAADLIELSIRSNRIPATAVIEDTKNSSVRKEVTLSKHVIQLKLKPGTYRVVVSYQQETINRVMELTEDNKSITFNADFNK